MNYNEKTEISQLPPKYRPLSAFEYFGYTLLFAIPLIGFICLILFAVNDDNINRRSYARSFFVTIAIGVALAIGLIAVIIGTGVLARIGA